MNVNRRIILVSKICYDKIDENNQLCTFLNLITDPDLCERCYLHYFTYLTGFEGCQEQPLLERYA